MPAAAMTAGSAAVCKLEAFSRRGVLGDKCGTGVGDAERDMHSFRLYQTEELTAGGFARSASMDRTARARKVVDA